MDKFEYKIKADEIKELIARQEYEQAVEIADSIDWRRVKSVMMLCTVSDLYKMCRRYEDSRDLLLLAYDRHPGGRTIVYSLCELSVKMEEFVQAIEYYKEYVQIAPKDAGRYILQYKLYEAQDVSLEERIAVLEELKKKEYREKWAYELAYLYHRVGLATKCVEECDELFLWFGDGKYVAKALELKRLHAPLTPEQQYKYESRFGQASAKGEVPVEAAVSSDTIVMPQIQKTESEEITDKAKNELLKADTSRIPTDEVEIQVKTFDVGQYDTINLQEELAAGIQEYLGTSEEKAITESIMAPMISSDTMNIARDAAQEAENASNEEPQSEVFFGETGEIGDVEQMELALEDPDEETEFAKAVIAQMKSAAESMQAAQPPREMAEVLSMEGDGQISFVLPEREPVEKQITGQISINDIILEWERLKKENEEKRKEEVRQHVLQQTGEMFTVFEASVRDGLLEKLESGEIQESQVEDTLTELFEGEKAEQKVFESVEEIEISEEKEETADDIGEVEELEEIQVTIEEEVIEESRVTTEEITEEKTEEIIEEKTEEITEETVEEISAEPEKEVADKPVVREKQKVRNLTREEKELYGKYIQGRSMKEQLIKAVDGISMAAYTGNVIVTGDDGMDSLGLAKNIVREVQMTDSNFSGKIAKISGESLNTRDIKQIINDLNNGALIIQKAAMMKEEAAENLHKVLQQENLGIVVVLEDTKKRMEKFLAKNENLIHCFTSRVDIEALSNDALVMFAKKYAREKEYSIDELGLLALHTRIADMQTSDHAVTVMEVKEIMDEAIASANRKTIGHFFDIIFAKRYDDEDMIILKEKDFM